jgi:hypothetical protein
VSPAVLVKRRRPRAGTRRWTCTGARPAGRSNCSREGWRRGVAIEVETFCN